MAHRESLFVKVNKISQKLIIISKIARNTFLQRRGSIQIKRQHKSYKFKREPFGALNLT